MQFSLHAKKKKSKNTKWRRRAKNPCNEEENPSIEVQFFAQKEALPEATQFLQEKFVAKCHIMVQKIHNSNSMQVQYTKKIPAVAFWFKKLSLWASLIVKGF